MSKKLFIATQNRGKIREFKNMFENSEVEILTGDDIELGDIEESGKTFHENALIKAKAGYEITGISTIADDSGLEVDALNGEPGVYSARYAGENANDKDRINFLLNKLKNIATKPYKARFKSIICYYINEDRYHFFEGVWEGEIEDNLKGNNGFGYDPIFFDPTLSKRAAELSLEEKSKHSHRGKALKQFFEFYTKEDNE